MTWKKNKDVFALMTGHGKSLDGSWDCGCTYGKYTEAALMQKITKYAVTLLRRSGVKVISDSDDGNNKNMKACVKWANKTANCKYYMSVHCDYKLATPGVAPLYVSSKGKTMATKVGKSIAKYMGMKWKGAFKRKDLYELNATEMTAVIMETGSIKGDLKNLKRYRKYGRALARAICLFIGVEFKLHTNPYNFRVALKKTFADMKKLGFKYKGSGNKGSWAAAKKTKTTNCATYTCYALQRAGILKPTEYFYIYGDEVVCRGSLTLAKLKKIATITHPHKKPKNASLKKGDIVGYGDKKKKINPHTQTFAGWTKNGKPKWFSISTTDLKASSMPRVKPSYTEKVIYTKIRLKP